MTDSGIKYVGVDGCKAGWIGVGLDDGDGAEIKVCGKFGDVLNHFSDASLILVDIPIGLLEEARQGGRDCDKEARKALPNKRKPSVFSAPTRPIVNEVIANPEWRSGLGVTRQTFGIIPKIDEVDKALSSDENASSKVREAHPEVCFWALNGKTPMQHGKRDALGFEERIETLRSCARNVDGIDVDATYAEARREYAKAQVADDDILDALALAITAKIGCQRGGFKTLPENPPTDSKGLPMEMVYAIP